MARLIKIYDADWANRRRRAARLDETVWRVASGNVASQGPLPYPVWLLAAALAEATRAGMTLERWPAVRCRAEEE